ncbi:hypothetical protein G6F47_003389 [Rhizopus delemar]|nr:hypothetical protein G6F52_006853 [Rhizopus delemar]KAG1561435.1 hypothetical protein G6F49_001813 [Rhizopus delemar]KAG1591173.1 hypothetical protein G6F48_003467 [Rhizopus delemar]KAG1601759.1 hypothetical protein G6F47_003389 [Rhizopus delemar]KAG1646833.1 hypothetical protein G6F44_000442 [Rhizopus delemar]
MREIFFADAKITEDENVVNTARKLLKDWKIIKKTLTPKKDKARSNTFNNVNNGAGVIIVQPAKLAIHNNANPTTNLATAIQSHTSMKRSTEDVEDASSSGIGTWENLTREKKKVYQCLLGRFLRCAISKMAPREQLLIMKSINEEEEYTLVDGEVINACREIQLIAANQKIIKDEAEDAIARIKTNSNNKDIKLASNIVSDCLFRFLNNTTSNNHKQGEAVMIIDKIKPYLLHSLISKIDFIKHDWLTYHLVTSDGQIMMPDFVLFIELSSAINDEVFFMEVKRKGNHSNNTLENDMIKLSKEMHIALNKLVVKKVKKPEVVGLLVEDHKAVAYKMDIKYNGQYRMIEISRFHFARDISDDILLLPAIIEKLNQMKKIIERTVSNLYNSENEEVVDLTAYTRKSCKSPLLINQDAIKV